MHVYLRCRAHLPLLGHRSDSGNIEKVNGSDVWQTLIFRELVHVRYEAEKEKNVPWFRTVQVGKSLDI